MALYRIKNRWDGFAGAPGYSILHFSVPAGPTVEGAQAAADKVGVFNVALKAYLPVGVSVTIEADVEVIDTPNGEMQTVLSIVPPVKQTGTAAGTYSSAAGACVTWSTAGVRRGRRVRGRTFLVPLNAATAFEGNGTLSAGALTNLTAAAAQLHTGDWALQVYSRPSAPGVTDGAAYTVTGSRISDKTAILRSRRD